MLTMVHDSSTAISRANELSADEFSSQKLLTSEAPQIETLRLFLNTSENIFSFFSSPPTPSARDGI